MGTDALMLVNLLKTHGYYDIGGFDGCACTHVSMCGVDIHTHCWRTRHEDCDCDGIGVHVESPDFVAKPEVLEQVGELVKKELLKGWPGADIKVVIKQWE